MLPLPLEKAVYLDGSDEAREAVEDSELRLHTRYLLRTQGMKGSGYTRYVNSKDILAALTRGRGEVLLEQLSRPLKIIDANRDLADVLNELIAEKRHMAGVTAESGEGLCGIITLEDVLEEILGEIDDEHSRA